MKETKQIFDLALVGGTILSMDDENNIIHDGLILIKSGYIEFIGPGNEAPEFEALKTIYTDGKHILPAFFNQHTHLSLSLYRGLGTDLSLHNWLQKAIWPLEQAYANPDNVYLGSILSLIEMIRNGTGTIADMDFHSLAVGKAVEESGLRAFLGEGLFDGKTPSSNSAQETFDYTQEMISKHADNELISIYLAPHAPFSCSPELYEKTGDLARKWNIPVCSHVSETKHEVDLIKSKYGLSPVKLLERTGVFKDHFILVHGVHLDDDDIHTLAANKVPVIHNPHSNMVLGSGLCPVKDLSKHGVKIGIGTDSAASNNHLSMLRELQTAYLIHKGINHDPTLLPAKKVVEMATKSGYEIYRMRELGQLSSGFKADLQVIDMSSIHNQPVNNPFFSLVSTANTNDIRTLIVNGKLIMEDKKILTIDEELVFSEAKKFGLGVRESFPHLFNTFQKKGGHE